jgi:hypothetical protein
MLASCQGKETNMKVMGWKKVTFAGVLSMGVLFSSAAAQDTPQDPTVTASTPRERQIELALSAAPSEVSSMATVYVLGPKGYEKVREGTNGFSCFIWRSFKETMQVSAAPACFDAEGSRTLMVTAMRREELRSQGKSKAEIEDDIARGYQDGHYKAPGPGFLYMLSTENYFYDSGAKQWDTVPPHVMFYAPYKTAKDLGYESKSLTLVPHLTGDGPEALMIVVPAKKPAEDSSSSDSHKH